ncbi:uncharacterized protein B0I36DRAFT_354260 [Microdochium trichocladiopsis]|uniref:Uncharacterized protein n=1 Tax=Microdochium trichocladiopsis TaxID=1682393 RepID=A0A9P9BKW8_9PEZI|nr:uncharacterized protein B0I36DRAFT_354260 [Microdochium trichocladiopsis]KAH7021641.1 hypothetical protein B0I36DRAFT_354260 [Microdochium trichocladiopsis]
MMMVMICSGKPLSGCALETAQPSSDPTSPPAMPAATFPDSATSTAEDAWKFFEENGVIVVEDAEIGALVFELDQIQHIANDEAAYEQIRQKVHASAILHIFSAYEEKPDQSETFAKLREPHFYSFTRNPTDGMIFHAVSKGSFWKIRVASHKGKPVGWADSAGVVHYHRRDFVGQEMDVVLPDGGV